MNAYYYLAIAICAEVIATVSMKAIKGFSTPLPLILVIAGYATAFWMLVTIEKTFNTIWRVRQPRRGVSSFLLYWAILSLGPLLLGGGFAISTYITSLSLISGPDALLGVQALLKFMPA